MVILNKDVDWFCSAHSFAQDETPHRMDMAMVIELLLLETDLSPELKVIGESDNDFRGFGFNWDR